MQKIKITIRNNIRNGVKSNPGYFKQYYRENKDRILESKKENNKKYYEENKEKIAEYSRMYYEKNKEKVSEYGKKRYEENKKIHLNKISPQQSV